MARPLQILTVAVAVVALCGAPRPPVAAEAVAASPLVDTLARHLERNPQAPLDEVAALANAAIATSGVEYRFDAHVDEGITSLELQGQGRTFVASVPGEGKAVGPCGELWVLLPLAALGRDEMTLVQDGQAWPVERPPELVLDSMAVLAPDGGSVLATIEVPWQSLPFGVTEDGSGVVLRAVLPEAQAAQWWENQRARDPLISASYPFLPLIVTAEGVRYAEDPMLLRDPPANPVEAVEDATNAYHGRIEFLDPHYIVDFTAPCT